MVYCDRCGNKAGPPYRYCRICGAIIHHPPILFTLASRLAPLHFISSRNQAKLKPKSSKDHAEVDSKFSERVSLAEIKSEPEKFDKDDTPEREAYAETQQELHDETYTSHHRGAVELVETPAESSNPSALVTTSRGLDTEPKMDQTFGRLLSTLEDLEKENSTLRNQLSRKRHVRSAGGAMIAVGIGSLLASVVFGSSALAFTGLGLMFWGALLIFARVARYVRVDLVAPTLLPTTKAISEILNDLDYTEKGVYIPGDQGRVLLFIPSEPVARIPSFEEVSRGTFLKNPNSVSITPPGLGLAEVFQRELGLKSGRTGIEAIAKQLPRLLIDDLEIARNFEIRIKGREIGTRVVDPLYSGILEQLDTSRTTMCDDPISSAVACLIAWSCGEPVEIEKKTKSHGTIDSLYRIL
jgi:hypothetical protein